LRCCVVLYDLTGAERYAVAVNRLTGHPDERIRRRAIWARGELGKGL
jgi:hypothetical protein